MITKTEWIKAIREVIKTYKQGKHLGSPYSCPLCALSVKDNNNRDSQNCTKCILLNGEDDNLPCVNMLTYPAYGDIINPKVVVTHRIKFWEKGLKILNKLPATRFKFQPLITPFPELWDLDEQLGEPKNK